MLTEEKMNLEKKGIELCAPATVEELELAATELQVRLDQYYMRLFLSFDGFASADFKSQINMWGIKQICTERHMSVEVHGVRMYAIGDLTIDSDFIIACLEDSGMPVLLLSDRRVLASSLASFLNKLSAGHYDFVK